MGSVDRATACVLGAALAAGALWLETRRRRRSRASQIKLTYFNIHGAAEPVRLALVLTGTAFEDERLTFDAWKFRKSLAKYGQLPIMKITTPGGSSKELYQSSAMLRWVGANFGDGSLFPLHDGALLFDIDEVLGLCDDLQRAWAPALYVQMRPQTYGHPEDWDPSAKAAVVQKLRERFAFDAEGLPRFLHYFSERLGASRSGFLCGPCPTIADLRLLPLLRQYQLGKIDFVPASVLTLRAGAIAPVRRDLPKGPASKP